VGELAGDILAEFRKWQVFANPLFRALMRAFMKKTDVESLRDFVVPITREMIDGRSQGVDYLFYGAPCVLLFHQSPFADPVDGSIACTYAMIAAESLGLGTCMIGTVAVAMNRGRGVKKKWGIPAENTVALALILGYPAFRYASGLKRRFASVAYV
jgi:nitroreductase